MRSGRRWLRDSCLKRTMTTTPAQCRCLSCLIPPKSRRCIGYLLISLRGERLDSSDAFASEDKHPAESSEPELPQMAPGGYFSG